jgi:hypothetical protein
MKKITREMVVRKQFSKEDCIKLIESQKGFRADLNNKDFDVWDQLLVCESVIKKMFTYSDLII